MKNSFGIRTDFVKFKRVNKLSLLLGFGIWNLGFGISLAQELNCSVQVLHSQIQSSDKRVFETLRNSIYEFMNNRKWTDDVFKTEERIECSMLINISEWVPPDVFKGTMQIQSRRPVYNSSYPALLLNFNDNNIEFTFISKLRK